MIKVKFFLIYKLHKAFIKFMAQSDFYFSDLENLLALLLEFVTNPLIRSHLTFFPKFQL